MLFTILCSKAALQTRVPYKLLSKQGKSDNSKENIRFSSETIMGMKPFSINQRIHSCWLTRGEQRESHGLPPGMSLSGTSGCCQGKSSDHTGGLHPANAFAVAAMILFPHVGCSDNPSPQEVSVICHAVKTRWFLFTQNRRSVWPNNQTQTKRKLVFTWSTTVGTIFHRFTIWLVFIEFSLRERKYIYFLDCNLYIYVIYAGVWLIMDVHLVPVSVMRDIWLASEGLPFQVPSDKKCAWLLILWNKGKSSHDRYYAHIRNEHNHYW